MTSTTPHDALFRSVFSRREEAASILRDVLPEELARRVNWSSLELQSGHFVDPELAGSQSDLLYKVDCGPESLLLYLLFEHQSTVDALMPYRLLRYMVRLWEAWLADHKNAKHLPPVIPIVLSHAESGWTAARSMSELYKLPSELQEALRPHLPDFVFLLEDLARRSDLELQSRTRTELTRLALLLLRHGRDATGLPGRVTSWSGLVTAVIEAPGGKEALRIAMRYVILVSERNSIQDLAGAMASSVGKGAAKIVMTLGEELIALGEERGRAQGRAQGEVEGRARGEVEGRARGEVEGRARGEVEGRARGEVEGRARALAAAIARVFESRGSTLRPDTVARLHACTDVDLLDRIFERALHGTTESKLFSDD